MMEIVNELNNIMVDHRRESNQSNIIRSLQTFEYSNYSKIFEFVEYQYCMKYSHIFRLANVESAFVQLHKQTSLKFDKNNRKSKLNKFSYSDIMNIFENQILTNYPIFNYPKTKIRETLEMKVNDGQMYEIVEDYDWKISKWVNLNDYKTLPIYISSKIQSKLYKNVFQSLFNSSKIEDCAKTQLLTCVLKLLRISLPNTTLDDDEQCVPSLVYELLPKTDTLLVMDHMLNKMWKVIQTSDEMKYRPKLISDVYKNVQNIQKHEKYSYIVFCLYLIHEQLITKIISCTNSDINFFDELSNIDLINFNVFENISFVSELNLFYDIFENFAKEILSNIASFFINVENENEIGGVFDLHIIWNFICYVCYLSYAIFEYWKILLKTNDKMYAFIDEKYCGMNEMMKEMINRLSDILRKIDENYGSNEMDMKSMIKEININMKKNAKKSAMNEQMMNGLKKDNILFRMFGYESCLIGNLFDVYSDGSVTNDAKMQSFVYYLVFRVLNGMHNYCRDGFLSILQRNLCCLHSFQQYS